MNDDKPNERIELNQTDLMNMSYSKKETGKPNERIELSQTSFSNIDENKRLKLIKDLDVKGYLDEIERISNIKSVQSGFIPNEDQALLILHKARYFLARQGHLDKKLMKDSRRWLLMNGFKLPNI